MILFTGWASEATNFFKWGQCPGPEAERAFSWNAGHDWGRHENYPHFKISSIIQTSAEMLDMIWEDITIHSLKLF